MVWAYGLLASRSRLVSDKRIESHDVIASIDKAIADMIDAKMVILANKNQRREN